MLITKKALVNSTASLPINSRTLPVKRLLTGHGQQAFSFSTKSKIAKLNVDVIRASSDGPTNDQKHIVFLHGLFGKGQSFQFLAKAKAIQQNNFTCHLVDMRNHGLSERHPVMDYESLARDVHAYMESVGITANSS